MRLLHTIAIFVLGLMTKREVPVPTYPAPFLKPGLLEQVKRETVLISIEGFSGGYRGTGVLIDSTTVLTCEHMVESDTLWIYTYPVGRVIMAHPIRGDDVHDLALLKLDTPVNLSHYAVINTTTTIGQPVVVVGNTLGAMKWFVSYGMISDKEEFYDITTALIRGGNSGGPWVNLDGELVALTDWGPVSAKGTSEGIGGGIDGATIQKFLNDWKHPVNVFQLLLGN